MSTPTSSSSSWIGGPLGIVMAVILGFIGLCFIHDEAKKRVKEDYHSIVAEIEEFFEIEPEKKVVRIKPPVVDTLCAGDPKSGGAENPGAFIQIAKEMNVPVRPEYGAMLSALAEIESSTTGNYAAEGKIITDEDSKYFGDHAYGRCQIMGKNIPEWSKQVLGIALSPKVFINKANHEFQDIVCYAKVIDIWKQRGGNVRDVAATWQSGLTYDDAKAKKKGDGISKTANYAEKAERLFNHNLAVCRGIGGFDPNDWTCPTDQTLIVSAMGWRTLRGKPDYHEGLDIDANDGDKNYAVADGKVIAAGPMGDCGNGVVIDHGNGIHTTTCHHKEIRVKKDDLVKKGQVIGLSGTTGNSTGIHCHLSVSLNGRSMDPQGYLPNRCKSGSLAKLSRTLVAAN